MEWIPAPRATMENDVTPSAVLDYTEVQTYLRLDGTDDQTLVENLISAVTDKVENFIGKKLITQVWSVYYDFFPRKLKEDAWWDGSRDGAISELYYPIQFLRLPFGPCQSLYFFNTYDSTDGTVLFDASSYTLDNISGNPKVALRNGFSWPTTMLRPLNGIHIKATFGYGTKSQVPNQIKEAIKIGVANLYEHRGDIEPESSLPNTAQMLLQSFKRWKV